MNLNIDLSEMKVEEKPACKGVVARASVSSYYSASDDSINERRSLRILKRKSCSGCEKCGGIHECLREDCHNGNLPLGFEAIEHGKLYSLDVEITSRDWETGYADDWQVVLKQVKE